MWLHQSSFVDLAMPTAAVKTTTSKTRNVTTGWQINVVYIGYIEVVITHTQTLSFRFVVNLDIHSVQMHF